jgi:hypothetical protein
VGACCEPGPGEEDNPDMTGGMSIQLVAAFALTSFVGALMLLHGVSVNLLQRRPVRCHSCGGIAGRTCNCHRDR